MRLGVKTLVVFLLVALFAQNLLAQPRLSFNTAQQQFTIPVFRAGTVAGLDNDFVKMGIIPPITQSRTPVEIRVYRWTQGRMSSMVFGRVFVIEGGGDSVSFINYSGREALPIDTIDPLNLFRANIVPANNINGVQYYKWTTRNKPPLPADSLFNSLISDSIFELKDETETIKKLQLSQAKNKNDKAPPDKLMACDDCYFDETLLVEMKVGDKIRNFKLLAHGYGEPEGLKPQLTTYAQLRDFLFALMY